MLKDVLGPPARAIFTALNWVESRAFPRYTLHYNPTFILGPPRSGSTLLYQSVAFALATSYFTNLANRLRVTGSPAIPVIAARLVKTLRLTEHHHETFDNYYGRGKGWGSSSNGLEIWDTWFPEGYIGPGQTPIQLQRAIYQAVAATERISNRPFINKGQNHSVRIQALVEIFPEALFIQCLRSPLDMAQSIFIARTRDFPFLGYKPQDPGRVWFSVKPKEYKSIKDKGLIEQICEQVYFTEQNIAADRQIVGQERFHFVHYRDFCQRPRQEIEKIAKFMNERGAPTQVIKKLPAAFTFSNERKLDQATYRAMADHLETLYGQAMEPDQK